MAAETLALDSFGECDSNNFSEELFDTDSESDLLVNRDANGTSGSVNSPNIVPAANGSRPSRRLFADTADREESRRQPLGDATNPRSPASVNTRASESDTQILILEESNSRLDSFSEH